jgi:hypothetical protein
MTNLSSAGADTPRNMRVAMTKIGGRGVANKLSHTATQVRDSDAGQITVGGELNKLANNVALGRDVAEVRRGVPVTRLST